MIDTRELVGRLRASVRFDALNGDHHERSVCRKQMIEAADTIEFLQRDLRECVELLRDVRGTLRADEYGGHARIARKIDALLARYRGTPNLSALQESDDAARSEGEKQA